jgi:hypothetical protein
MYFSKIPTLNNFKNMEGGIQLYQNHRDNNQYALSGAAI